MTSCSWANIFPFCYKKFTFCLLKVKRFWMLGYWQAELANGVEVPVWLTVPVCLGPNGVPPMWAFSAKTWKVPGKRGWINYFRWGCKPELEIEQPCCANLGYRVYHVILEKKLDSDEPRKWISKYLSSLLNEYIGCVCCGNVIVINDDKTPEI